MPSHSLTSPEFWAERLEAVLRRSAYLRAQHSIPDVYSVDMEGDERGSVLIIDTDDGTFRFRVEPVAEELYDVVKTHIGPWLYERDQARADYHSGSHGFLNEIEREEEERCAALGLEGPNAKQYRADTYSVHADHLRDRERGK